MDVYYICILVFSYSSFTYSMEQKKPTPIVQEWMQLAYDAHYNAKKFLFHYLSKDIQGHIFAQVHPRQTIDEWWSHDAICIQQITAPDKIDCFDVYNDLCVYACKNPSTNFFELRYIDLDTGINKPFGTVWKFGFPISGISIANNGTQILLKEALYNQVLISSLHGPIRYIHTHDIPLINKNFAYHTQLPFAASINQKGHLYIHTLDQEHNIYKGPGFVDEPIFLAWHPTKPILAVAHKNRISVYNIKENSCMENTMKSNFESVHFTFDGSLSWTLQKDTHMYSVSFLSDILCAAYNKTPITYDTEKFKAKGIGDSVLLLQDSNEKTSYVLQSIKEHKQMPAFNPTHQYRLPRNYDYRYITVNPSADNNKSIISIYVPRSNVSLPYYCIMKAALEAKKIDNQANWNLFKKPAYKKLINETAEHYQYFAKLKQKFIDQLKNNTD